MEINGKKMEKAAKTMAKSDKLFLARSGDYYYICNGYWLVKVHKGWYDVTFRPVSPRYIELADGEGANSMDKKRIPEKANPIGFEQIIGEAPCNEETEVTVTDFIRRTSKWNERIVDNNDTMMIVNNDYMEIMENLMGYVKWYGTPGNALKQIYTDFNADIAGIILPIRPGESDYCVVKAA